MNFFRAAATLGLFKGTARGRQMQLRLSVIFVLLFTVAPTNAVVIRHDVAAVKYLATPNGLPALVDLPHEGHGILIAPQWVVTVAHTVFYDYRGKSILVGDTLYTISHVIFQPGQRPLPEAGFSGDSAPLMAYLHGNNDIALIKLEKPVKGVQFLEIYRGREELGKQVRLFGKGRTGDGLAGEDAASRRGILRMGENQISAVQGNWLVYRFDAPSKGALPLEAMQGGGDSGGAVLITVGGKVYLAGLPSWQRYEGDLKDFKGGLYGADAYQVRLSSYAAWIDEIRSLPVPELDRLHHKF
jgi:Trypsin